MTLEVKAVYLELEGGFWGLVDTKGNQFMPINLPEQLKQKDKSFKVAFTEVEGMMSFAQWGKLIEIIGFSN